MECQQKKRIKKVVLTTENLGSAKIYRQMKLNRCPAGVDGYPECSL
jgi:hypothetical protein